jgi:SEC-C motif-containing protein
MDYADCCGRMIEGGGLPATAETLMRSRYTAYALGNAPYLLSTWHASMRPVSLNLDEQPAPQWIGLKVLWHEQPNDNQAVVAFVARYKINGRAFKLRETSRFVKEDGQWFYLDGDIEPGAE